MAGTQPVRYRHLPTPTNGDLAFCGLAVLSDLFGASRWPLARLTETADKGAPPQSALITLGEAAVAARIRTASPVALKSSERQMPSAHRRRGGSTRRRQIRMVQLPN